VRRWSDDLLDSGVRLVVVEVADYEVRRELLRAGGATSIARLDALGAGLEYEPLRTATVRLAAQLWADARNRGVPTADLHALDGDVLIAAQALVPAGNGTHCIVATTNLGHLGRYVVARP